jgi:phosphate transport system substrate-binding protein
MNHRNFGKAVEAVSPVVATLLLVLVAAGAAIGFGVFLNGFQKKTQDNVSSETPAETLHIGGSSTVWELTEKALPAWKAAHPSIAIDNQEGGSGAGKQAICKGLVDIAASSSAIASSGAPGQDLATCPDVNGDGVKDAGEGLHVTTVAYDGVVMAIGSGNTHCTGTLALTKAMVQELYKVNGGSAAATAAVDGLADAPTGAGGKYAWQDVAGDVDGAGPLTASNTCTGTGLVVLGSRADPSGTEDGFCTKVLAGGSANCVSGTNQMLDSVYSNVNGQVGNDGIRSWLNANGDRLSFIGFGSVAETGSGLTAATLEGTTASAATIKAAGALPSGTTCTWSASSYCAARPLLYVTAGAPSATEQLFLDFMTSTLNNQNFAKAAGYVSIF